MKDWVFGRFLMDEAGDEGGGGSQPGNGEGGTGNGEGAAGSGDSGGEGEETPNALAEDLNKADEGSGISNQGAEGDKTDDSSDTRSPIPDTSELTEEESKKYDETLKLDEKLFGKTDFDPYYRKEMPAFFKRHGIEPDKANKMANEFAAMQKKAGEAQLAKMKESHEKRMADLQKMNEAYFRDYDKPARETIGKAIKHFVKKDSPLWHTLTKTEIGVDKEVLELLHFAGERLPNDNAHGGEGGAGSATPKSLADSFMGL